MKFRILLFVVLLNTLAVTVNGQNETIRIKMQNAIVRDVLKEIESKTSYRFFFSDDFVDIHKVVNIDVESEDIKDFLSTIFQNSTVTYKILENNIVVITPVTTQLQGIVVTGRVTDETGDPVSGANVLVKGTKIGVTTDMNGRFSIVVPDENATLQFSFVGYITREEMVGAQKMIDMVIAESIQALEEVVVVAYGTVRRRDLTVAAEVVDEKQLLKTPTVTLAQSLQGNTSGLMVAASGSEPGADVVIRVRGSASISAGNDPLVVIDNVPCTMADFAALNPNDVVSITVLKDAAATAPYGSRASNGVLMITTKSGEKGEMRISVSGNYSLQRVYDMMDVMDGFQYANYANLAYFYSGANSLPFPDLSNVSSTDFQRMLIRDGHYAQANIQLSGGSDKATYFVSANVIDQKGVTLNSKLSRLGLRANIKADLRKNLKFTFNSSVAREERQTLTNRGYDSGPMFRFAQLNPTREIPRGLIFDSGWFIDPDTGEQFYISDVTVNTLSQQNFSRPFTFGTSSQIDWTVIPGLTASVRGGVNYRDHLGYHYTPRDVQRNFGTVQNNNKAERSSSTRVFWFNENYLTYDRTFYDVHNMRVTLGHSVEKTVTEGFGLTLSGFESDRFGWNSLGATLNFHPPVYSTSSSFKSMVSAFSILSYNYRERYYLNATYRADASSRFGPDSKWGYFPSASVMWNVKNEDFLNDHDLLSQLRLRLSWGKTGNDAIDQGISLSNIRVDRAVSINGAKVAAAELSTMGNADIKWENTTTYNIGLETGLMNDALCFTVEAYYKKTADLLYRAMLPLTTGLSAMTSNIGSVENKGVELTINSRNFKRKDFRWTTNFNISWNANKVLDLGGEDIIPGYAGSGALNSTNIGNGGVSTFLKVGEPMYVFMGYRTSIWQNWDEIYGLTGNVADYNKENTRKIIPGMYRYWGNGEDGTLTTELDDRVILGHTIPDFTAGITNTFRWKELELAVFFVGAWGNKIFNGNSSSLLVYGINNNSFAKANDCYRPMNVLTGDVGYSGTYPTPVANISRNDASNTSPNGGNAAYVNATSERFIEDGSYLRLKTLSLTCHLPKKICSAMHIQSLALSLNVMNLWTLTRYSGMDPEMSSTMIDSAGNVNQNFGIDLSANPAFKTYTINLNFKF